VQFLVTETNNDELESSCKMYGNRKTIGCGGTNVGANFYISATFLLEDGEPCPLHWTSYHHTSTGCEAHCKLAYKRNGNDDTCMPGKPECANWLGGDKFPQESLTVNTWCICGAKLKSEADPDEYFNAGTILATRRSLQDQQSQTRQMQALARQLHEDLLLNGEGASTDKWEWPNPTASRIDQHHGDHFDVTDRCFGEITRFRTSLVPASASCAAYVTNMTRPPDDLVENGYDPASNDHAYCREGAVDDGACCVVHRGSAEASRVWLQTSPMETNAVAKSFERSIMVGTSVHTSRVATVGNFVRKENQTHKKTHKTHKTHKPTRKNQTHKKKSNPQEKIKPTKNPQNPQKPTKTQNTPKYSRTTTTSPTLSLETGSTRPRSRFANRPTPFASSSRPTLEKPKRCTNGTRAKTRARCWVAMSTALRWAAPTEF